MNVKTLQSCDSLKETTDSVATETTQISLHNALEREESLLASSTSLSLHSVTPPRSNSLLSRILSRHVVTPDGKAIRRISSLPCRRAARVSPRRDTAIAGETPRSYLVYLIRHGEASHNVLEKAAKRRAKEQSEAQGLSPEQVQERMEEARIAVLEDENHRDASLSEQGRHDARETKRRLDELVHLHALPYPTKVLVSPLTRTLETANLIFPNHDTIHVREEIQERKTGKPCDCRQSSRFLLSRPSFRHFQMDSLRQNSFMKAQENCEDDDDDDPVDGVCSDDETSSEEEEQSRLLFASRRWNNDARTNRTHQAFRRALSDPVEEDRATLRERTRKLLGLLDEPSIAVVTHKGYLRELERGTLGQPHTQEFDNGEIRVYRVYLDASRELEKAERVV